MRHTHWPLFDLEVRTPRIVLRYVDDEIAEQLAELAAKGIHDPATMPFAMAWTDAEPPLQQRNTLQHYWRSRAETTPDNWQLPLAVFVDGQVTGTTNLHTHDFPVLRQVETGSWLGREHQGKGIGREMREASLHLAFAGLGALLATSGAFVDNPASLAVTRRLGYTEVAHVWKVRRGVRAECVEFQMPRSHWEQHLRRDDIEIVNLEPCLPLLLGDTPG